MVATLLPVTFSTLSWSYDSSTNDAHKKAILFAILVQVSRVQIEATLKILAQSVQNESASVIRA